MLKRKHLCIIYEDMVECKEYPERMYWFTVGFGKWYYKDYPNITRFIKGMCHDD